VSVSGWTSPSDAGAVDRQPVVAVGDIAEGDDPVPAGTVGETGLAGRAASGRNLIDGAEWLVWTLARYTRTANGC